MENVLINRCGYCLFAEGSETVNFCDGTTNYIYQCILKHRKNNIVVLNFDSGFFRWHNQKACENFERAGKILRKREDLKHTDIDFLSDEIYEIITVE
jgi:hypothetical protein